MNEQSYLADWNVLYQMLNAANDAERGVFVPEAAYANVLTVYDKYCQYRSEGCPQERFVNKVTVVLARYRPGSMAYFKDAFQDVYLEWKQTKGKPAATVGGGERVLTALEVRREAVRIVQEMNGSGAVASEITAALKEAGLLGRLRNDWNSRQVVAKVAEEVLGVAGWDC